ncbi:MAG TPA: radical SAM protein [Terriglobia bacterium]|nr:radical SAM protein [Terriglobia bacterium]
MLKGIHILLTLKCTNECDHCFLHCGPTREATFTLSQLRSLLRQIKEVGTVEVVYFEGGEPFLFYPLLLEGLRMVRAAGFGAGIVTNCYWATSIEDALLWLKPIRELGIADFSISDDDLHRFDKNDHRAEFADQAAQELGIPISTIRIDVPCVSRSGDAGRKGKPVVGGGVLFKGRAAEKLTSGLPVRPSNEFTTCPHEDLLNPERVHIDAYGNVHICQGLSMGNVWEQPLAELIRGYDPYKHSIFGPLLRGGPSRLAVETDLTIEDNYVDECHLCYTLRKQLLRRYPTCLAPKDCYGL